MQPVIPSAARDLLFIATLFALTACGGGGEERSATLQTMLDTSRGPNAAAVIVTGVTRDNLAALRKAAWTADPWTALLRVAVSGRDSIAIAGRYAANDTAIVFTPTFPFDRGRSYSARLDPAQLPHPLGDAPITTHVQLPMGAVAPTTRVVRMLPTAAILPENDLRIYLEFSAPMSRRSGVDFIHLIDDNGREVTHAFLPLDADFWSPDHMRYTVFLDPGRVKRGILPNEQMGRALRAGRAYAIMVDSTWPDANGIPLAKQFRAEFRAGPAVLEPLSPASWMLHAPRAGTREPFVVTFARSLDHGLLQRAIAVALANGETLPGIAAIGPGETEWRFTPANAWRAGDYSLVVLSILEDVAGNRVGRAFEVDIFDRADSTSAPERYTVPFKIR